MAADCFLPTLVRQVGNTCLATVLTEENGAPVQDGDALKDGIDRPNVHYGTTVCGLSLPNGKPVEYCFSDPVRIESVHLTFDSDLNRETLPGDPCERTHSTRANVRLDSPKFHLPLTLCKAFRLELDTPHGTEILLNVTQNSRRSYCVPVEAEATALRLIPLENYGGTAETRVFSFDFR